MTNGKDKEKENIVGSHETERPEISQEISPEKLDDVLSEGHEDMEKVKAMAGAEIKNKRIVMEKEGAKDININKLNEGVKKFEDGVRAAENDLKERIKTLQSETGKVKSAGRCLRCNEEVRENAKFCTKCGNSLSEEEGLKIESQENTELMSLEEAEKFFDSIKEKAISVSISSESLLEKRKKIFDLFSEMSEAVNKKIAEEDLFRTEKGKEAGRLLLEIQNDIDKNPDTLKEIEKKLQDNRDELQKLFTSKEPEKEDREKIAEIEGENSKLNQLYNDLDKEGRQKEIEEKSANAFDTAQQTEEKNNETKEELPLNETEIRGNEEAQKEINDLLVDPASELAIKTKAIESRQELIRIAKERIEKERKESVFYNERVKAHNKTVSDHEAVIDKFSTDINAIKNKIIKKHGGRIVKEKVLNS
jgi:hypothetical protein